MFLEEQLKEEEEDEETLTGKDEEDRRIAEMGRPMLGDHVKLEIIIEESYEFKVRLEYDSVFLIVLEATQETDVHICVQEHTITVPAISTQNLTTLQDTYRLIIAVPLPRRLLRQVQTHVTCYVCVCA